METPSEWAKRFNRQKTEEEAGSPNPKAETADSPASVAEFPSEPFQCPACGQLLAPACRVCVACKHIINPAEIGRPQDVASPAPPAPGTEPSPEPVRYPWRIFLVVLGIGLILGQIFLSVWGEQKGPLIIQSVPVLVGLWVFFDALRRGIPRPLRWAVGSMLLLILIFPWYLARRSKPQAQVPFVEGEVGPVTRFLLYALLIIFLVSLIFYLVEGPPPGLAPTAPPKEHKSGGKSQVTINNLRLWKVDGRRSSPGEGSRLLPGAWNAQAETSAPSDALQT